MNLHPAANEIPGARCHASIWKYMHRGQGAPLWKKGVHGTKTTAKKHRPDAREYIGSWCIRRLISRVGQGVERRVSARGGWMLTAVDQWEVGLFEWNPSREAPRKSVRVAGIKRGPRCGAGLGRFIRVTRAARNQREKKRERERERERTGEWRGSVTEASV